MTDTRDAARLALIRALFPDLAERLDAALSASGTAVGPADGFDAWLDDEVARLREGPLAGAAFASVPDVETRIRLERAFAAARTAAGWLGSPLPEPEAFEDAGVDFARLGAALAADPELEPVPAPYGVGADGWREAFGDAARRPSAPLGDDPLVFATEVQREFARLDDAAAAWTVGEARAVRSATIAGDSIAWTLRLVPAGARPQIMGLGFAHGTHVSLPEMLMLQLMRVAEDRELLDRHSFTWLAGPLADGRLAARHVFDAEEGAVRITTREIGNQGPHLGARPPIA